MKVRPFALKVWAAKGVLTRRIYDAECTVQAVIDKGSITSIDADIQDMRQHLLEVRSAREAIVTAYTAIMCVDVPQITETYEKNLDEQIERAVQFEREIKRAITQYEIEIAQQEKKSDSSGSSKEGFNTPRYQ